MHVINNRYEVIETLYSDSVGTIFRVSDRLGNAQKIMRLKLLSKVYSDIERIHDVIDLFSSWKTIQHPYIDTLYDLDIVEDIDGKEMAKNRFFYTFEDRNYENIIEYYELEGAEKEKVIVDLCKALAYLHSRGYVYGNLDFNALVFLRDTEGNVSLKLKSMIFTSYYHDIYFDSGNNLTETLAPETFFNEKPTKQADIYALGILIYYIRFGEIRYELIVNKIINSKKSDMLMPILLKSVQNDPHNRYSDAYEMLEEVKKVFKLEFDKRDFEAYNRLNLDIGIVGQNDVINSVIQEIQANRSGYSKHMMFSLYGKNGMGKSTCIREISYRLRLNGFKVIFQTLNGYDKRPFGRFAYLLDKMVSGGHMTPKQIQKYGSEFVKILPDKAEIWAVKPSKVLNDDIENYKIVNRIVSYIEECNFEDPLVFVIDNIEFLSKFEKMIINIISSSQNVLSLYIICTCNLEKKSYWRNNSRHKAIEMPNLSYGEQYEYIKRMLGQVDGVDDIISAVLNQINGTPLEIKSVLKDWFDRKHIFVDSQRSWKLKSNPIYLSNITSSILSVFPQKLYKFYQNATKKEKKILELMAVYGESIYFSRIKWVYDDISDNDIDVFIKKGIENGILSKCVGDLGYAYSFQDRSYMWSIVNSISDSDKRRYNRMSADILLSDYGDKLGLVCDRLVYHLIESRYVEKASKICIQASKQMESLFFYKEAIYFLQKAIDVIQKYELLLNISAILNKMGKLNSKINQFEQAKKCFEKAKNIAYKYHKFNDYIDAELELIMISQELYGVNEIIKKFESVKARSIQIGYFEGELKSQEYIFIVKLLGNSSDLDYDKLAHYTNKVEKMPNEFYIARFYSLMGVCHSRNGQYFKASRCFNMALKKFEEQNNYFEQSKVYNNIGDMYELGYVDNEEAIGYYKKAYEISCFSKILEKRYIYLYNLGCIYAKEHLFEKAIEFFNEANTLSVNRKSNKFIFLNLLELCDIYLYLGDYSNAKKIFNQLKKIYNDMSFSEQLSKRYYILLAYYNVRKNNFIEANNMIEEYHRINIIISGGNIILNNKQHCLQKILNFWVYWKNESENILKSDELLDKLKQIFIFVNDAQGARIVRQISMTVGMFLAEDGRYEELNNFLELDGNLIKYYDSSFLVTQRKILSILLSDFDQVEFKNILLDETVILSEEWLVFVYKKLGDKLKMRSLYEALCNYFKAFECIKRMTEDFSEEELKIYLLKDSIKLNLRYEIDMILTEFSNDSIMEYDWRNPTESTFSVNAYFTIDVLEKLYSSDGFLDSLRHSFIIKYGEYINDYKNLISSFSDDLQGNLYKFMLLCMKETLADKSCLYIEDDLTNTWHIIKSDPSFEAPDIKNLIYKSHVYKEGVLRIGRKLNQSFGKKRRFTVSMILLPIFSFNTFRFGRTEGINGSNDRIIGYLYLESDENFNRFNEKILAKIRNMMNLCSVLIQNYILERRVCMDKLTGVYLRSFLEEKFSSEFATLYLDNRSISVVMIDVDNFKGINDKFGHRSGDMVLRQIGDALTHLVRKTDIVGRYGGDEFVVLLPDANCNMAYKIMQKINKYISSNIFVGNLEYITISSGIASYPEHANTKDELIEKADKALYNSKKDGKNTITIYDDTLDVSYKINNLNIKSVIRGDGYDEKRIQSMIDLMKLCSTKESKIRIKKALNIIMNIVDATEVIVLDANQTEGIRHLQSKRDNAVVEDDTVKFLYNKYAENKNGMVFIDWENPIISSEQTQDINWKSRIIVPLYENAIYKGIMILSVSILYKEFTDEDYILVKALASTATKLFDFK